MGPIFHFYMDTKLPHSRAQEEEETNPPPPLSWPNSEHQTGSGRSQAKLVVMVGITLCAATYTRYKR